jgi:uroporphyrinogen-III decarboxylase
MAETHWEKKDREIGCKMSPLERTITAMGFKEADRVPYILAFQSAYNSFYESAKISSWEDIYKNVDKWTDLACMQYTELGTDSIVTNPFWSVEADALGSEVQFKVRVNPKHPATWPRALTQIQDITKWDEQKPQVPDPETSPILSRVLKVTENCSKRYGDKVVITGWTMPPITLAMIALRETEKFFMDAVTHKDVAKEMIRICTDTAKKFEVGMIKHGAHAIAYVDGLEATFVMRPQMFLEWGWEPWNELIDETVANKAVAVPHICGGAKVYKDNYLKRWSGRPIILSMHEIAQSGFASVKETKDTFYGKIPVMGFVTSDKTLTLGNPEDVDKETKENIRDAAPGGGYMCSAGCEAMGWRLDNYQAMSEAIRKYGKYPIKI